MADAHPAGKRNPSRIPHFDSVEAVAEFAEGAGMSALARLWVLERLKYDAEQR